MRQKDRIVEKSTASIYQRIDSCDSDHEWYSSAISGNTADERLEEQSLVF